MYYTSGYITTQTATQLFHSQSLKFKICIKSALKKPKTIDDHNTDNDFLYSDYSLCPFSNIILLFSLQ